MLHSTMALVLRGARTAARGFGRPPAGLRFRSPKLPPLTRRLATVRCIDRASRLFPAGIQNHHP